MKANCSVFIATSLDGFIARSDGSIDWLNKANTSVPPGEDCGYQRFISTVDTIVMGRNTFEQVLGFGAWPYGALPVVVMSRRLPALPKDLPPAVSLSREGPGALVARLSARGVRHIYVDGGATIRSFLAEGLIDDLTITLIPLLLGSGKPLFGPLPSDMPLVLESSLAFDFGFVQNRYRVRRDAAKAAGAQGEGEPRTGPAIQ